METQTSSRNTASAPTTSGVVISLAKFSISIHQNNHSKLHQDLQSKSQQALASQTLLSESPTSTNVIGFPSPSPDLLDLPQCKTCILHFRGPDSPGSPPLPRAPANSPALRPVRPNPPWNLEVSLLEESQREKAMVKMLAL